LLATFHHIAT